MFLLGFCLIVFAYYLAIYAYLLFFLLLLLLPFTPTIPRNSSVMTVLPGLALSTPAGT